MVTHQLAELDDGGSGATVVVVGATSLTAGMLLALMRRRPDMANLKKPHLRPSMDGVVIR